MKAKKEVKFNVNKNTLLLFRTFCVVYFIIHAILEIAFFKFDLFEKSITFFSQWIFWITFMYFVKMIFYQQNADSQESISKLTLLVLNANLEVFIGYFLVIFPFAPTKSGFDAYHAFVLHVFPCVVSIADYLMNSNEIRIFHWKELLAFKAIYYVWNFIYVKMSGKPIYKFLL